MPLPLAGARIKASDLALIFPGGVDAGVPFIPTLTQSATVTKTSDCTYMKVGRLVVANYSLAITGTGTATNVVLLGLPPFAAASPAFAGVGSGMIFDSSATLFWNGTAIINSSTTAKFAAYNANNYLGAAGFTAALAAGDILSAFVMYMATS